MALRTEDPFTTLSRVANLLNNTRQTERLSALTPAQLVTVAIACLNGDWDVTPDYLDADQIRRIIGYTPARVGERIVPDFTDDLQPKGTIILPAPFDAAAWVAGAPS